MFASSALARAGSGKHRRRRDRRHRHPRFAPRRSCDRDQAQQQRRGRRHLRRRT
ncbi:hypothetical protein ACRAWD_03445 [Caulobacter segnis]